MTRTRQDLQMLQALPLDLKISMTKARIRQWVNEFGEEGVYVSFSGGKDSTVLLHLVREMYPKVQGVFVDTGLEYPEIREFVKTFDNIVWLRPKMNFRKVIEVYGYPFISKQVSKRLYELRNAIEKGKDITQTEAYKEFSGTRMFLREGYDEPRKSFHNKEKWMFMTEAPYKFSHKCCDVMKKSSFKMMEGKYAITAQMAQESINREKVWLLHGCNAFDAKTPISNPMSFWREQDVLCYIYEHKLSIASVYGEVVKEAEIEGQMDFADMGLLDHEVAKFKTTGLHRTGCVFCGYGCQMDGSPGRFERMKETHPKQYDYIMRPWEQGGLGYKEVIDWINEHGNLNIRY